MPEANDHVEEVGRYTLAIQNAIYEASLVREGFRKVSKMDAQDALEGLATVAALIIEALPPAETARGLRESTEQFGKWVKDIAKAARAAYENTGIRMIDGSTPPGRKPS